MLNNESCGHNNWMFHTVKFLINVHVGALILEKKNVPSYTTLI